MTDAARVSSDLLGCWVRKGGDYARGIVRAVWVTGNRVHVLVQVRHNRHDWESDDMQTWTEFSPSEEWR